MSIYATQWVLKFPSLGDFYFECEWVNVLGQGVPAHIGTPTSGHGYEKGDPYASFLPPAIPVVEDEDRLRAIVVVRENEEKIGQEYVHPLLVLSGDEYAAMPFQAVHDRICDALRGNQPRLIAEAIDGSRRRLIFEDGLVVEEDEELP